MQPVIEEIKEEQKIAERRKTDAAAVDDNNDGPQRKLGKR